ncbi:hypothetical protein ES703_46033 [subsurface metagenome]
MDAGVEHLGRGTARAVDAFIIVVEPGRRSIQTAEAIRDLAQGLGIERCYVVGSKTTSDADRHFIIDNMPSFEVLGFINHSPMIIEADLKGISVFDAAPDAVAEATKIKKRLEDVYQERRQKS